MPRLITFFVAAYWTTFFAILALASVGEVAGENVPLLAGLVPAAPSPLPGTAGWAVSAILAIGFLLVAVLFLWTLATTIFEGARKRGDGDGIARMALCAAACMMAGLLVVGVASGMRDTFSVVSTQLVALLVSHVAILADAGRAAEREREALAVKGGSARTMALGAARNSMLSRLSHRDPGPEKRF